ncbi:IPT/TIG domain-containing protein [Poritiphilus flavus]|uniref:IPT/TIG domain-containing protein n=1 Tax=Poritiphilus flavus TaxID=2697053 RepID=A0A6L9E9U3_9FLAO|nr:IPT/TIG domain-containing protein [Poritiphilus flavus]NAS11434.1 hypothetical protein [Poritiphilus flavus]
MAKKFSLTFALILVCLFSCTSDDPKDSDPNGLDRIEVTSFKILNNDKAGITSETEVLAEGDNPITITDHGVFLQKNNQFYDKVALGALNERRFQTTVSSGLVKGESYSIYPYIFAKNTYFYGDTLDFVSNVEIDFEITEVAPLKGFINDTIVIKGRNFCISTETNKNILQLGDAEQRLVFESDSLLKFVVLPNISMPEFKPELTTCGVSKALEQSYSILPPVFDSIAPYEAYVGQTAQIHGENFHSNISKLWIEEKEIALQEAYDIDKLTFQIPEGLSAGLLDVKIQVLDKIIEKTGYYQSTTPVIEELDKRMTGFLDTLTIKGKYFLQPNKELDILVGGRSQTILSATDNEIEVVIDQYFEEENPELVLKTASFELTEEITMLPPEIISIEKDVYHILEEEIKVKTKYFIPTRENMEVGGGTLNRSWSVPEVDEEGNIIIYSTRWLKSSYNWEAQFGFAEIGEIEISLTTAYGNASQNYKVYPPQIDEINETQFFYGDEIRLEGTDFAYNGVSEVLVDGQALDTYSMNDSWASFYPPFSIAPGSHTVKVITGGQESNEIDFEIIAATATALINNSGTRKDIYTITGTNLERSSSYAIAANGTGCKVISNSETQLQFTLPYNVLLEPSLAITFTYGNQITNVGNITGIEPFENYENLQIPNDAFYWLHSGYNTDFEYSGKLYNLNLTGLYEYDIVSNSWSAYDTNVPGFSNTRLSTYKPSVNGDEVYVPSGNGFQVYDMVNKSWEYVALSLEVDEYLQNGVVLDDVAYVVTRGVTNADPYEFYIYDLNTHTRTLGYLPAPIRSYRSKMYQLGGKIIYDIFNENIFMYNPLTSTWEDLGHPMGTYKFNYDVNIYEYNNKLYYSGGQGNSLIRYEMYAYDFVTKTWTEKTPMPVKLLHHVMIGQGDYLYFGLGESDYYLRHSHMYRYKISEDPH